MTVLEFFKDISRNGNVLANPFPKWVIVIDPMNNPIGTVCIPERIINDQENISGYLIENEMFSSVLSLCASQINLDYVEETCRIKIKDWGI